MPILDNWIESPLSFLEECIGASGQLEVSDVKEYFKNRIQDLKDIYKIPSISEISPDQIKPSSLVRCRCMVQDQFDPDYYLGHYETFNKETGEKKLRLGMFRDTSDCKNGEEIVFDSKSNVTLQRQSLYCVPVPGENDWVKQELKSRNIQKVHKGNDQFIRAKRQRDDEDMIEDGGNDEQMDMLTEVKNVDHNRKHQRESGASSAQETNHHEKETVFNPNFPLPGENKSPFIVIMYDNEDSPKLNEVYEFIGIMSCDPILATVTMDEQKMNEDDLGFDDMVSAEEHSAHCPPSSLVPRIHCILAQKLIHTNPLISVSAQSMEDSAYIKDVQNEIEEIREIVVQTLTKILFGDRLAAEYLLLNIISRVYGRVEPMVLGKMSLNMTKCPSAGEPTMLSLSNEISKFFEIFTTKSHFIPLTISNLNKSKFVPRKDYSANRLTSGMLQLSEGTHLILDETVLEPGQLDTNGVQNVTAVGNVIQWQKVEYDFQFHKFDIKTDITVLILSEARSLLQCDCIVPLKKQETTLQSATSIMISLDPHLVNKMRIYLEMTRLMDFNLTDQMQEVIKEDYVGMREADDKAMNPEAFHLLLVMARLVSISFGNNELTSELWKKTKELEMQRNERLSS